MQPIPPTHGAGGAGVYRTVPSCPAPALLYSADCRRATVTRASFPRRRHAAAGRTRRPGSGGVTPNLPLSPMLGISVCRGQRHSDRVAGHGVGPSRPGCRAGGERAGTAQTHQRWGIRQAVAGGDRRDADEALVAAVAAGATKQEAAQLIGVGERTVYRRLDDPDFRRRVDQARAELVSRTVGKLADASTAAVTTLCALLEADSESIRLGAARAILELGLKLRASEEFERRLSALEEQSATESHWKRAA